MTRKERPTVPAVRQAMDRVLAAERAATDTLQTTRETAERTLARARNGVRRIEDHCQQRITEAHHRCARETDRKISELRRQAQAPVDRQTTRNRDRTLIRRAVDGLARSLTSLGDGDG